MTEILHSWITGLTAAGCLAALARQLTPDGPVKKVTKFVCGIMLVGILIQPLVMADEGTFSLSVAEYRKTVRELTADMEAQEKELLRTYIEEESSAYILDEAQLIGIPDGRAEVRAKWGDESWLPYEAYLTMRTTEEQKIRLSRYISAELGIPPERQHWSEDRK